MSTSRSDVTLEDQLDSSATLREIIDWIPLDWYELILTPAPLQSSGSQVDIQSVETDLHRFGLNVVYDYDRGSSTTSLRVSSGPFVGDPHIYLRQQQENGRSREDLHHAFCTFLQSFLNSGWKVADVSDVWNGKRRSEVLPRFNELCAGREFPEGSQERELALALFSDTCRLWTFVFDRVLSPENGWPDIGRLWAHEFDPFASLSSCQERLRALYPEDGSSVFFNEINESLGRTAIYLERYRARQEAAKNMPRE